MSESLLATLRVSLEPKLMLFLLAFTLAACVTSIRINPESIEKEIAVKKSLCSGDWIIAEKRNGKEVRFEACEVTSKYIKGCDDAMLYVSDIKTLTARRAQAAGKCLLRSW